MAENSEKLHRMKELNDQPVRIFVKAPRIGKPYGVFYRIYNRFLCISIFFCAGDSNRLIVCQNKELMDFEEKSINRLKKFL